MKNDQKLNVAVVGLGYASDFHIPGILANSSLSLVAISDLDQGRLASGARRWNAEPVSDYRYLIDRKDIDIIGILTPPASHLELALPALDAGKHLVLEKPITADLDEADQLLAAAKRSHSKVVVAYILRFVRQVQVLRQLIVEGALGDLEILRVLASTPEMLSALAPAHRRDRSQGGGSVIELGVHHYDLFSYLLGSSVDSVMAMSRSDRFHDQSTTVAARMSCGTLATTSVSLCGANQYQVELIGTKARATASLLRYDGLEIVRASQHKESQFFANRAKSLLRSFVDLPHALRSLRLGGTFNASFHGLWGHLADSIVADYEPVPGLRDGRSSLAAAIASSKASLSGSSVSLRGI